MCEGEVTSSSKSPGARCAPDQGAVGREPAASLAHSSCTTGRVPCIYAGGFRLVAQRSKLHSELAGSDPAFVRVAPAAPHIFLRSLFDSVETFRDHGSKMSYSFFILSSNSSAMLRIPRYFLR